MFLLSEAYGKDPVKGWYFHSFAISLASFDSLIAIRFHRPSVVVPLPGQVVTDRQPSGVTIGEELHQISRFRMVEQIKLITII